MLFYSRRIGLAGGHEVPIEAGGRLTGRVGRYSIGVIDIQTDSDTVSAAPSTNFSVLRVKRDILRRSSIGAMCTGRSNVPGGADRNDAYGVDGTFEFFTNLAINTYWARTRTTGTSAVSGDDTSYRAPARLRRAIATACSSNGWSSATSSIPKSASCAGQTSARTTRFFRFSPRPATHRGPSASSTTTRQRPTSQTAPDSWPPRCCTANSRSNSRTADRFTLEYERRPRAGAAPVHHSRHAASLPASYGFGTARVGYTFGKQRPVSGTVLAEYGTFYNGHRTALTISRALVNVTPRLSLEPTYSINYVTLPEDLRPRRTWPGRASPTR